MAAQTPSPRPVADALTVGTLLAHGAASDPRQLKGTPSYFVRLKTDRGVRELWDAGLKQAFASSRTQPQVGEEVGIRRNSLEPISFIMRKTDAQGRIITER